MKRTRQRLALRLAASAIVGVVATVGIAWGIADRRMVTHSGRVSPSIVSRNADWPHNPPDSWRRPTVHYVERATGFRYQLWVGADRNPTCYSSNEFGLPALAMGWVSTMRDPDSGRESSLEFTISGRMAHLLPLRPLWPGFALDTAFYGTLAFLLWSAPGFVRRTRRRRRGLCVVCGYELKGMQKCPECGL